MRITEHFYDSEFACHDGTPYPKLYGDRLEALCGMLELIREELGSHAITVTSGYRTRSYNRKVGGVPKSQHIEGRAADIKIAGVTARKVHAIIEKMYNSGRLPMLRGLGSYKTFTHVDIRPTSRLAHWSV